MKKLSIGLLVLVAVLFSAPAFALGPFYLGANYSMTNVGAKDVGSVDDFDMDTVTISAGLYLLDFLAVEARAGTGVSDDTVDLIKAEIGVLYGLYARAELPLGMFKPYVIAGYTAADLDSNFGDDDDSDLSYGAGVDLKFSEHLGLNLEYMLLMEFDTQLGSAGGIDVESISLGAKFYF
jgi:opacity protein-like surface antigen